MLDIASHDGTVLTGRPTLAAVNLMMSTYGYDLDRLADWGAIIRDNPGMRGVPDYARQSRTTARYVKRTAGGAVGPAAT